MAPTVLPIGSINAIKADGWLSSAPQSFSKVGSQLVSR